MLKKKNFPNNKEILVKERERVQSLACCAFHKTVNCSPGDADVIHYTGDKSRIVVYPDLALCLIVLKANAMQSALHAALLLYLKANAPLICLVKFLYRKNFQVCSPKTQKWRYHHARRPNYKSYIFLTYSLGQPSAKPQNDNALFLILRKTAENLTPHPTNEDTISKQKHDCWICHGEYKVEFGSEIISTWLFKINIQTNRLTICFIPSLLYLFTSAVTLSVGLIISPILLSRK